MHTNILKVQMAIVYECHLLESILKGLALINKSHFYFQICKKLRQKLWLFKSLYKKGYSLFSKIMMMNEF